MDKNKLPYFIKNTAGGSVNRIKKCTKKQSKIFKKVGFPFGLYFSSFPNKKNQTQIG